MQTYTLTITIEDEDGQETQDFDRLGEGDVEIMKTTSRMAAPLGATITHKVTAE